MTREEIKQALANSSFEERKILMKATPLERQLMLEAKFYAGATISTPPKEVYGVLRRRHT